MNKFLVSLLAISTFVTVTTAYSTQPKLNSVEVMADEMATVSAENIEPRLFTNMEAYVRWESGYVYGVAKNTFTLFSSTVSTWVYLYSSETKTSDTSQMTMEATTYIYDLDQGHEISCKTPYVSGRYWKAVVTFKSGSQEKTIESKLCTIADDGTIVALP